MGEAVMELGEKELEKIGKYVQTHLEEWSRGSNVLEFRSNREIELLERMVRIEEGLKNIAEQMQKGFEYMERRFEDMQHYMDKRFNQLQWTIGIGFTMMTLFIGLLNYFG